MSSVLSNEDGGWPILFYVVFLTKNSHIALNYTLFHQPLTDWVLNDLCWLRALANAFFDPPIGGLYIVGWVHPIYETYCLIYRLC